METTSLSSRGQIVIPQKIREKMQINEGEKFAVTGDNDLIVLKRISFEGFDELIRKTRGIVKENKIKQSDVEGAIVRARE